MSKETLQQPENPRPQLTEEGEAWFKGRARSVVENYSGPLHFYNNSFTVAAMESESLGEEYASLKDYIAGQVSFSRRMTEVSTYCSLSSYHFCETRAWVAARDVERMWPIVTVIYSEPDFDVKLLADPFRLTNVVGELIGNAFEAKAENIVVEFKTQNSWLEISVSDNGVGIAKTERLFATDASTKVVDGQVQVASYGLVMAKSCALAHGGKFEIVDHRKDPKNPRNLTVATISLPLLA